jgi:hypothetical protein
MGFTFPAEITYTFVNGNCVYARVNDKVGQGNTSFDESIKGERMNFEK